MPDYMKEKKQHLPETQTSYTNIIIIETKCVSPIYARFIRFAHLRGKNGIEMCQVFLWLSCNELRICARLFWTGEVKKENVITEVYEQIACPRPSGAEENDE